jgi:asparagine synthase (glutamine-hydrolysing)
MCGIYAHFHNSIPMRNSGGLCALKRRGPNNMILTQLEKITLGFTHLKINGFQPQPMTSGKWWILCNGEIFNHFQLETELGLISPPNASDCWVLPYLFDKYGFNDVCQRLDGEFAIIAYNSESNTLYAYRDPFGVRPLYIGKSHHGVVVASEMKAMKLCGDVKHVLPGACTSIDSSDNISTMKYYTLPTSKITTNDYYGSELSRLLIQSVKKRYMSDKPVGALLSGGLDSSIICAILVRHCIPNGTRLKTFSIGTEGSPDLKNARIVANYLNTDHHEIVVTADDFIDAIREVIYSIESYDITTVRASVGNWLVGRYIAKHSDCKVIFNGDGADELFGGYLYMRNAPCDGEFEKEIERLLSEIHMFDVLRSDRCIAAHGLETRTPYLDKEFVQLARSIPTLYLRSSAYRIEKSVLRSEFHDYLPNEIIQRKKEAFSDGVNATNTAWFRSLIDEKDYYRSIFSQYYPGRLSIIQHYWMPRWSPETSDPSARTLNVYMN